MIHLHIPSIPTSINALYQDAVFKTGKVLRSRRVLSEEGRRFKRETLAYLVKNFQPELRFFKRNVPYVAYYRFMTTELQNKTWPKSAENRYKKFDASNLIKVLEDVLVEAAGVDDSSFLTVVSEKRKGPREETHIWIWNIEEEGCPFHDATLTL